MSGRVARGAKELVRITTRGARHDRSRGQERIKKESDVAFSLPDAKETVVKFGFRIRRDQEIESLVLQLPGSRDTITPTPEPVHEPPAAGSIAQELTDAFGRGPDEKWVAYTQTYCKSWGQAFISTLALKNFDPRPNGFQVVPSVYTYTDKSFAKNHYLIAVSILSAKAGKGYHVQTGRDERSRPKTPGGRVRSRRR